MAHVFFGHFAILELSLEIKLDFADARRLISQLANHVPEASMTTSQGWV